MEAIMQRIQKALQKEFSSKGIILEDAGDGFVGGWVISKSFEGLNGTQRQQRVWSLFDKHLARKDQTRLSVFLTFTPLEKKMIFEETANGLGAPSSKKAIATTDDKASRRKARNMAANHFAE